MKSKYKQLSDALTCVVFEYAMELGLKLTEIVKLPSEYIIDDGRVIERNCKWLEVEPMEGEITATAKRMINDIANMSGDGMIYHRKELIHIINDDGLWLDLDVNRCRLRTLYYPESLAMTRQKADEIYSKRGWKYHDREI